MAHTRTRIGKFEILRLLGQGTMGEVYLARDANLGREVAIKTVLPGSDFGEEGHARFQREARAMAALNHPNIVTLYDFGFDDGVEYLVMEYLDGETLGSLMAQRKLSPALLMECLAQACEGLGYAHDLGIVHRDVKPGNILVTVRAGRLQTKLTDFGIAALDQSSLTQQGSLMGSVSYMAPEYLQSGKATASADIFAAGVVLYEILSGGQKPFPGDTPAAAIGAILGQPPAPMSPEALRDMPGALMGVVTRALDKDPNIRFATADDLATAIRQAMTAAPAQPPAPVQAPAVRTAPGQGQPIVVGRGSRATCLSLRVALRQAEPGTTILVLPGVYKEPVAVAKEVTIQGEGDASEIQFASGLTVEAGGILTLVNVTVGNAQGVALRLRSGGAIEATDCCFKDSPGGGAELGPGSGSSFLRCWFTGNGSAGVLALGDSQAFLEDCEVSGNLDAGVHACGAANVVLRFSRMNGNEGMGLSAVDGASASMDHCALSKNEGPAVLLDRGGIGRLSHCLLVGGLSLGIACRQEASLVLEDCQVEENATGGIMLSSDARPFKPGSGNRVQDPIIRPRPRPAF
jgi:predicted Ser/Thr protein kinase